LSLIRDIFLLPTSVVFRCPVLINGAGKTVKSVLINSITKGTIFFFSN